MKVLQIIQGLGGTLLFEKVLETSSTMVMFICN